MKTFILVITTFSLSSFAAVTKDFILWDNAAKHSRLNLNEMDLQIQVSEALHKRETELLAQLEPLFAKEAITEQEVIDARLNLRKAEAEMRLAKLRKQEAQLENAMLLLRRKFEDENKDDVPKLADLSWRQWSAKWEREKVVHELQSIELERTRDRWQRIKKLRDRAAVTEMELIKANFELRDAEENEQKSAANVKTLEKNVTDALRLKNDAIAAAR